MPPPITSTAGTAHKIKTGILRPPQFDVQTLTVFMPLSASVRDL